jgi:hypothetical protein
MSVIQTDEQGRRYVERGGRRVYFPAPATTPAAKARVARRARRSAEAIDRYHRSMPPPGVEWTWPDWRDAPSGSRFRHNRSGRTGTFIRPAASRSNGAIVVWDDRPFPVRAVASDVPDSAHFVAIAREATPITEEQS